MNSLLRAILLCTCVAGGLGLAVWIATTSSFERSENRARDSAVTAPGSSVEADRTLRRKSNVAVRTAASEPTVADSETSAAESLSQTSTRKSSAGEPSETFGDTALTSEFRSIVRVRPMTVDPSTIPVSFTVVDEPDAGSESETSPGHDSARDKPNIVVPERLPSTEEELPPNVVAPKETPDLKPAPVTEPDTLPTLEPSLRSPRSNDARSFGPKSTAEELPADDLPAKKPEPRRFAPNPRDSGNDGAFFAPNVETVDEPQDSSPSTTPEERPDAESKPRPRSKPAARTDTESDNESPRGAPRSKSNANPRAAGPNMRGTRPSPNPRPSPSLGPIESDLPDSIPRKGLSAADMKLTPRPDAPRIRSQGEGDDKLQMNFRDTDIREVLQVLSAQSGLNILASPNVDGKVSAVLTDVDVDQALAAILKSNGLTARREGNFVFVGTAADFEIIDRAQDRISTRVYRPSYVPAREVLALITPLLSQVGKARTSVTTPSQIGIPSDSTMAGGDALTQGDAVVVQDYETVLCTIDEVVKEIDRQPLQVAIEAMILSVKLSDEYRFGIDWQFLRDKNHVRFGIGQPRVNPLDGSGNIDPATGGTIGQFTFDQPGLTFAFLDSNLGAFLQAVETMGDTNIIATPRLMCLNKQRAEIHIGGQLGFRTQTITETSTTQNIQFLEVGTQLRIRPFITPGGMIRMEVHPELSTGQVKEDGLPEKEVTMVTTNVMVPDGSTFVIGGLIREDLTVSGSQVPLLGNIPYIGPLFRKTKQDTVRQEILTLVTPHLVHEPSEGDRGDYAATEFHRRQAVYADHMSPIGKRYLARKYFRRAQAAWSEGDRRKALRYVNLAIHIDPMNRAAIDLRSDIWEGRPVGEHTGHFDTRPDPGEGPWAVGEEAAEMVGLPPEELPPGVLPPGVTPRDQRPALKTPPRINAPKPTPKPSTRTMPQGADLRNGEARVNDPRSRPRKY